MKRAATLSILILIMAATAAAAPQEGKNTGKAKGIVPGSLLYGLEQFVEDLEVKLASAIGGPDLKAKAMANNAEERLKEAEYLAEINKSKEAAEMTEKYRETMNKSLKVALKNNNSELVKEIDNVTNKNIEVLERVKEKVPEEAKKGIQKAIDASKRKGPRKPKLPTPVPDDKPAQKREVLGKELNMSRSKENPSKSPEKKVKRLKQTGKLEKSRKAVNKSKNIGDSREAGKTLDKTRNRSLNFTEGSGERNISKEASEKEKSVSSNVDKKTSDRRKESLEHETGASDSSEKSLDSKPETGERTKGEENLDLY